MGTTLPSLVPEQSSPILIFDPQSKLNGPRPARIGDRTESTSKRSRTTASPGWSEGRIQVGSETTRRLENVPIEYIEKGGPEIDRTPLPIKVCSLPEREVFIFETERTRGRKRAAFIAESERIWRRECGWVPEGCGGRIEMRLVRLGDTRNDVDTGKACKVTSGEQDIACCARATAINLGGKSGMVGQDT